MSAVNIRAIRRFAVSELLEGLLLPWLPMLLASVLYLVQLGAAPLWYDEAGSVWMAELPVDRLVLATAGDTHPPFYFLLLSSLQHVAGSTPWVMRLPSAAFALGVFALAYEVGRELKLSATALLVSQALLVLSPFQLHFAQEARMYSLLQFEVLLMLLSVLRGEWSVFVFAATLALWTHNYALVYLPFVALLGFIKTPPSHWINWLIFCCFPIILWLPWAGVLLKQMQQIAGGYWIQPVNAGSVIYVLYTWLWGFTMPEWGEPTGVMIAAGLVTWLAFKGLHERTEASLILFWIVFGPVALVVLASVMWKPILLFRGFAPAIPLLFLLTGWAFDRVRLSRRVYGLALLIPLLLATIAGHYLWNPEHKDGSQRFASQIRAQWQAGDVILHANEGTLVELHNPLPDLPQYLLPRCDQPNLGGLSQTTRVAIGMQEVDPTVFPWHRAWLVWSWPPTVTQCEVDRVRAFLWTYHAQLMYLIRDDSYVYAAIYLIER